MYLVFSAAYIKIVKARQKLKKVLLNRKKTGLADLEDPEISWMANNTKNKKRLLSKDQIQDTLRKQCSKGEANGVTIKFFVKTSES